MTLLPSPKARAVMKPGTVYAIDGGENWTYYGQVSPIKDIGFLKYRTRDLEAAVEFPQYSIMCRVNVAHPSIGRALRSGNWQKLGAQAVHKELLGFHSYVQWPVASSEVTVWTEDGITPPRIMTTTIDDPEIQQLERAALWDAVEHVPARLKVEYSAEAGEPHVGGPIWRERILEERRRP